MKLGKSYWSIYIDSYKLKQSLPKEEYFIKLRELQKELKQALKGQQSYGTEKAANGAFGKLPDHLKQWSQVSELTPVSLGLGWC